MSGAAARAPSDLPEAELGFDISPPDGRPAAGPEAAQWRTAATTGAPALSAHSRLGFHLSWNLAADAFARGASLWLAFWAGRACGIEGFGRFTLALAVAQWTWLAGDAAMNSGYATREVARDAGHSTEIATLFYGARAVAALVLSTIFLGVVWMLPLSAETRPVLMAAAAFFVGYGLYPDWLLRGRSEFRALALGNAIYSATLILMTLLVLPSHASPALAMAVWGGGYSVAAVWTVRSLVRRGALRLRLPDSLAAWWPHARRSGTFSVGSVLGIGCAQAPVVLVAILAGTHETGLFGPGFRLIIGAVGLFTVLWWPLLPVLAGSPPESPAFRSAFTTASRLVLLVSLPIALALSLFARQILATAFGPSFVGGTLTLAIGAWVIPLFALSGLLEQTSLALGFERSRIAVYGATLLVLVGTGLFAVPRFGAAGASAAMVTSYAFAVSAYGFRMRRHTPLAETARRAVGPLVLNGLLAGAWLVAAAVAHLPWWLTLAAGSAIYGAAVLALGWSPWSRSPRAPGPRARLFPFGLPALGERPRVSVLLAVRNESRHIESALRAVREQDYEAAQLEILVIDGSSIDDTVAQVRATAAGDARITVLANPGRDVARGLNIGLRAARGEICVRVDGHCEIPRDYVSTCVAGLRGGASDCVGGPVRATGDTPLARAIAQAMSSPLGVGGAAFRWATESREVDHLPFGAWRREVFERLGGFDERLVRNQDAEFSDRLRRAGGIIRLLPLTPVIYRSRRSLGSLWRQYFGYGFYKVAVIRKRGGRPSSLRHLVPATLVIGLAGGAALGGITGSALPLIPSWGLYALFLSLAAAMSAKRGAASAALVPLALGTMHLGYGIGFLAGTAKALVTREPRLVRRKATS